MVSSQNVMFDLGAGADFMSKMCRIDENWPFCDASDHYHTFFSTPIVKYTENESLSASPVNNINMFDKKADIMGMFKFEDQNGGFYQKIPFCDAPDHCHTFLSTPIVNYTENWWLLVSSVSKLDMLDKGVDTMGMFRSEDRSWADPRISEIPGDCHFL